MPENVPAETLKLTPFGALTGQIAAVLDAVTKTAEAIDHNPMIAWIIPAQYRAVLDEIVKVLEAADGFLHKTP